jgi:hypothetical protein
MIITIVRKQIPSIVTDAIAHFGLNLAAIKLVSGFFLPGQELNKNLEPYTI